jgi:hypothetical protein
MQVFSKAASEAPRLFFAPLSGAFQAVRSEFNRINTTSAVEAGIVENDRQGQL